MAHGAETAKPLPDNGMKIAIVGSGPALNLRGRPQKARYGVTIFEALHTPGGVWSTAFPNSVCPISWCGKEIKTLEDIGVKIEYQHGGRPQHHARRTAEEERLQRGNSSVAARACRASSAFRVKTSTVCIRQTSFLTRINLMKAYHFPESDTPVQVQKNAAVVGGGNVADVRGDKRKAVSGRTSTSSIAVRTRRLPARVGRGASRQGRGHIFKMLTNPTEILGDENGHVKGMTCVEMELGEPDAEDADVPSSRRAASTRSMWIRSSSPSATVPTR
jgi:glutamate synthase (NADPH/NADH) small chain